MSVILYEEGHGYPWAMLYEDVRWGWGLRMNAEMTKLHKLVKLQYMTIFIPSQPVTERPSLMPNHLNTFIVPFHAIHKKKELREKLRH